MSKYRNCESWLAPVRVYDPLLAEAIEKINFAICLADDIADRAVLPTEVSSCLWEALGGMGRIVERPEAWPRLHEVLQRILESELTNLRFIPGEKSVEAELQLWKTRASLLDLYFTAWVCADPSFDTPKNRAWFEKFKEYVLICDDCKDFEDDRFEDLAQCRRNYIVLKTSGAEGYFGWQDRKEEFKKAALKIKNSLKLEDPVDKRMKAFMR